MGRLRRTRTTTAENIINTDDADAVRKFGVRVFVNVGRFSPQEPPPVIIRPRIRLKTEKRNERSVRTKTPCACAPIPIGGDTLGTIRIPAVRTDILQALPPLNRAPDVLVDRLVTQQDPVLLNLELLSGHVTDREFNRSFRTDGKRSIRFHHKAPAGNSTDVANDEGLWCDAAVVVRIHITGRHDADGGVQTARRVINGNAPRRGHGPRRSHR